MILNMVLSAIIVLCIVFIVFEYKDDLSSPIEKQTNIIGMIIFINVLAFLLYQIN